MPELREWRRTENKQTNRRGNDFSNKYTRKYTEKNMSNNDVVERGEAGTNYTNIGC